MTPDAITNAYQSCRAELLGYAIKLVVRPDIAEELVQECAVRLIERDAPADPAALRPWLFRVLTNLGIDHLRRHATWRESVLDETRSEAQANPAFVAESRLLRGSPELRAIAKEHLTVCFSCTLRNLTPEQSAALLLAEVYGFTLDEIATWMSARFGQVKHWIQSARATLERRYAETCALVSQRGVCHQCVELSDFFGADRDDPLAGSARDVDARLALVRAHRAATLGPWHRQMLRLVANIIDES